MRYQDRFADVPSGPAAVVITKNFDQWIRAVNAPLSGVEALPAQSELAAPAIVANDPDIPPEEVRFMVAQADGNAEPARFAFTKFNRSALIRFFSGRLRVADQDFTAVINYQFMIASKMKIVAPAEAEGVRESMEFNEGWHRGVSVGRAQAATGGARPDLSTLPSIADVYWRQSGRADEFLWKAGFESGFPRGYEMEERVDSKSGRGFTNDELQRRMREIKEKATRP